MRWRRPTRTLTGLFKVAADFSEEMPRDQESQEQYARLIATLARKHELRPLDAGAVARVIEHSARSVGDEDKLSLNTRRVRDLISEADYWAREAGHTVVEREDVQKAIDAQIFRADRVRERLYEEIEQQHDLHRHDRVGDRPDKRAIRASGGQFRIWPTQPHHGARATGRWRSG